MLGGSVCALAWYFAADVGVRLKLAYCLIPRDTGPPELKRKYTCIWVF